MAIVTQAKSASMSKDFEVLEILIIGGSSIMVIVSGELFCELNLIFVRTFLVLNSELNY